MGLRRKSGRKHRLGRARLPPRLSPRYRTWLLEGLARGTDPSDLVASLVEATSLPAPAAVRAIEDLLLDPERLETATPLARRIQQLELVLNLQREARRTGHRDGVTVPRRPALDADTFFDEHYAPLLPVHLTEQIKNWPALER